MQEETEAGQAFVAQLSLSTALGDKYCYRPHFTDGTQVPKATRGGSGPSGCPALNHCVLLFLRSSFSSFSFLCRVVEHCSAPSVIQVPGRGTQRGGSRGQGRLHRRDARQHGKAPEPPPQQHCLEGLLGAKGSDWRTRGGRPPPECPAPLGSSPPRSGGHSCLSPTRGSWSQRAAAHQKRYPWRSGQGTCQQRGRSPFMRHGRLSERCPVSAPGQSGDKGEPEQPGLRAQAPGGRMSALGEAAVGLVEASGQTSWRKRSSG